MSILVCVLKNESENSHAAWEQACIKFNIAYDVVDITKSNWLELVLNKDYTCYLTTPSGSISLFKTLYDERLYIISNVLGKKIYPNYEELLIYENKKIFSYWLKANNLPHPETWVFYHKNETLKFAEKCTLPIVGKTSIGASGSGVKILYTKEDLLKYIHQIYSDKGIQRSFGPNLRKGKKMSRAWNVLKNIPSYYKKIKARYDASRIDPHRWFVILQEYIPCDFEWRAVKIGDSFFAHKKLPVGKKCSGTTKVGWDGPSNLLLDFVKYACEKRGFYCQAVDLFEAEPGMFLINEMQTFFGSESPHQMIIDNEPGRYIKKNDKWIFERGAFNTNNSYNLRLQHVLELIKNNKL